jgi:hypothetical protein
MSDTPRPAFWPGQARSSPRASVDMWVCACVMVTPGASRAAPLNDMADRSVKSEADSLGSTSGAVIDGTHRSGPNNAVTPMNPLGATPTIVKSIAFRRIVAPVMSARPPKRRCQKRWFSTTTSTACTRRRDLRRRKRSGPPWTSCTC